MCYRTGKYTVCRRVRASFSPEIVQAVAEKGLKNLPTLTWLVFLSYIVLNFLGSQCLEGFSRSLVFLLISLPSVHGVRFRHRRSLGIPRDERICTICDSGEVGDEFNYLLNCSDEIVKRNRTKCVDKYYNTIPTCPNSVASWTWLQILRMLSSLDLLVVFLS